MAGENVARTVELDLESDARLHRLADARQRSPETLMRDVILDFVAEEEWQEQLNRDTIAALAHYEKTGLHLTGEEVDAWLAKIEAGEDAELPECHV